MKRIAIALFVAAAYALAYVVAKRLDPAAMNVVVGFVMGISSMILVTLSMLVLLERGRRAAPAPDLVDAYRDGLEDGARIYSKGLGDGARLAVFAVGGALTLADRHKARLMISGEG